MKCVKSIYNSTIEVKRSKFIAFLIPVDEFKGYQDMLKSKHPKANHVVYALRKFNEYYQIVENQSDDGEPKGCAGVPVLQAMRGNDIVESAILIVRYFGGIKLGTGGMARAYKDSALSVIAEANLVEWERVESITFTTNFSQIRQTEYWLSQSNISHSQVFRDYKDNSIEWTIKAPQSCIDKFIQISNL